MKMIEAAVLDGKYWHDNNPVMNWMITNVAAKANMKDDLYPRKAREHDPLCKIDGPVTSIMSMGRWMSEDEDENPEHTFFVLGG